LWKQIEDFSNSAKITEAYASVIFMELSGMG